MVSQFKEGGAAEGESSLLLSPNMDVMEYDIDKMQGNRFASVARPWM